MGGYLAGTHALVVGVEDDTETGCVRMYLHHRSRGVYALVENDEAKEELRRAWAASFTRHLLVKAPPPEVLWTERERP